MADRPMRADNARARSEQKFFMMLPSNYLISCAGRCRSFREERFDCCFPAGFVLGSDDFLPDPSLTIDQVSGRQD